VRAVNDQGYPSRRAAVTTRHLQCHPNWLAPPEDRESRDELGAAGVPRGATMSTDSSAPVPGVHVREIPSGVRLISAVDTSTVAFLSEAQTGLPTTTYVRSWRDLTDHHPQSGDEGVGPPLAPRIWPNRCTATSRTVAARAGSSPSSPGGSIQHETKALLLQPTQPRHLLGVALVEDRRGVWRRWR
jgi:hypothetical protein